MLTSDRDATFRFGKGCGGHRFLGEFKQEQ